MGRGAFPLRVSNTWEGVISYVGPHRRFLSGAGRELLSSSCAAALLAGTSASAVAQDAAPQWGAWGELGAQAGSESSAFLEGFMPIGQDGDSLVFLDMRLDYGENAKGSSSFGLGLRQVMGADLILGANAFVDVVRTDNRKVLLGATLGLEAFTSNFDLRINAHVPLSGTAGTGSQVRSTGVTVTNNQLLETRVRQDDATALLYGLTGEIGALFDSPFGDNQRLRAYAGGYFYDRDGFDTEAGGRLGLEYRIDDVLSLTGSRFTLGAELVYDKSDKLDAVASARLRIPLFGGSQAPATHGARDESRLLDRMDEGVRRDKGIRAGSRQSSTSLASIPVVNPNTGATYGDIYYATQGGGGTGSFADPTSLSNAITSAGANGIVVVLGANGDVTTAGVTLQNGQVLAGGGSTIGVQLSDGSTTNFLLSGTAGTIDGDPGVTTVTLADNTLVTGLTLRGGTTVLDGNNVDGATFTNLTITDATNGISIIGASNTSMSNLSFSNITGTSILLNNQGAVLSDITIDGGTNGIVIANNTGTTTLNNISVSNVSGDALTFTNNSGAINVNDYSATNTGDDAIVISGGGTFAFSGTTQINGLGAGASSDGIDLSGTSNADLTFGDVDITGVGGGAGLNMAGADASVLMQSLDITGTGVTASRGVDISGTQNGRVINIIDGGNISNVGTGLVLGTNGAAAAAPDAVFNWGGGTIGGTIYGLDGVGVNAANGSYALGTTSFSAPFNFTMSGVPNYFISATATGTGDGSSSTNRASISTAIAAAAGLGTVNFILVNDGSAIDTSGLTFQLANGQTINTFGDGRTFSSAGYVIAANITGSNLPSGAVTITDPTGNGAATLTNSSGAVSTIGLANGNAVRNITIGSAAGTAISGSGIAGVTIEGVTIGSGGTTAQNGIDLNGTSGSVVLTNVSVDATGTGVSLTNTSGTVTGNNVDITGSDTLAVTGGDAAISFNASSSITSSGGTAVSIASRVGGSFSHFGTVTANGAGSSGISVSGATGQSDVTFGGLVSLGQTTALGGGAGVSFDNNGTTSTLAFDGGLQITTSGQTGLVGTGGGTLRVSNFASETITTTGAMALSLTGLNVQATFDSIDTSNSNMGSVALRDLDGSLAVNGGTLATVASGSSFNSFQLVQSDGAATRAFELAVDGLTITHDASFGSVGPSEHGIVVATYGDDSAVVSVSNSTFATEDSAVRVTATNQLVTVTNFANNTLLGSATSFDPDFFNNGVSFEGVTFDADLGAAGIQTVNGGTFASGTPGLATRNGVFFLGGNSGSVSFSDYTVNTVDAGLVASYGNNGLTLNIAGGSIDAGRVQLESTTGGFDGSISLSSMTLTRATGVGGSGGFIANNYSGDFTVTGATNISNAELSQDFGATGYQRLSTPGALSISNSSGDFTFGDITIGTQSGTPPAGTVFTTGGATVGISLAGNSGTFTSTGTVTITDTVEDAIRIADTSGAVAFNQVSIVNPRADLYPFTGPALAGTGREAHSAGVDISGTIDDTISFNDLDIALNSEETTGIELNGATLNAAVTANDFDVTGNGSANTIGVDLRGTTGGSTVRLGDSSATGESSSIAGVNTGVWLDNSTNAIFTFGDGEDGTDQGSTISANTAIDASSAPTVGSYDFRDVNFTSGPGLGFGTGAIYFVDSDGATGGGDGSGRDASNPMTLAAAEAAAGAGDIIVLINNGATINVAGTNGNDTLNLLDQMQLLSFGDGAGGSQAITVSLTVPPTILLSASGITIADPTGNGGAVVTSTATDPLVGLGSAGNRIAGVILDGGGTVGTGISGTSSTGLTVDRSIIRNFTGTGIDITTSTGTQVSNSSFSGNANDIALGNASGTSLSNITSTGATGRSIFFSGSSGTNSLNNVSIASVTGGTGLSFLNAGGTFTGTNVDISGTNGDALYIEGGDAAYTFDAASSIDITSGAAITLLNIAGGSLTHAGTVAANGNGASGIASFGATGDYSVSFTGAVDLGTTTAMGGSGLAVDNAGQNGVFSFADLDIDTNGSFGILMQNGGSLGITTGSLNVTNAQGFNLAGSDIAAGGITLTSFSNTGAVGAVALGMNGFGGGDFTVTGTTTISGTTGSAISMTSVAANIDLGTVNLTLAGGDGFLLNGNSGTLTAGDTTIDMAGGSGNAFRATNANGNMTFGNVDVVNLGAGTGLNLSGGTFDGQITFATLDITGNGSAGSKAIDLTGYVNTKDVVTTNSSAILNVQTGIDFTNANIGAGVRFQYGDGDATNPGTESTIDTTGFAVVTTGMGSTGEYDLEDVAFGTVLGTTNTSNLAGPSYYVVGSNGSTGAGNGTFLTPGTIAGAEASGADAIILVDNNDDNIRDVIDVVAQDDGTFTLADGQVLVSMVNGETVDLATLGLSGSGAPASLKLTGITSSTQVTASGGTIDDVRAILTSSSANGTVALAGSSTIQNTTIRNTGSGDGISASYAANATARIRSSQIDVSSSARSIDIATTGGATNVEFSGLDLDGGLRFDGSGGGSLSVTSTGINRVDDTDAEAILLQDADASLSGLIIGSSNTGTGNDVAGAGIHIVNSNGVSNTVTLTDITMGSGGNGDTTDVAGAGIDVDSSGSGVLTLNMTGTNVIRSSGQALDVDETGAGTANNVLLSISNTTFESAATGVPTVSITGQNVSTVQNSVQVRAFAGNTVIGNGTGGGIRFEKVDFDSDGAGATVSAGTLNVGQGTGTRVSGDGVAFIDTTGAIDFTTLNIYNDNGTGLLVDTKTNGLNTDFTMTGGGSGTVDTTNGTALFLDPLTMNLTFGTVTSTNASGSGVLVDGGDAVGGGGNSALTIGTLNISGSSDSGVQIIDSSGDFSFGATTINNAGSAGGGLEFTAATGDTTNIAFTGGLDIDTSTGTGITGGRTGSGTVNFSVAATGTRSINTTTGQGMVLSNVNVGAAGITFANATASGTATGNFIDLDTVGGSGTLRVNNTSALGVSGTGISIFSSSADFIFNQISLGDINAAGPMTYGLNLDGNSGSFTTTASSIIYYAQAAGIRIANAASTFSADFQAQIEASNRNDASYTAGGDGLVLTSNNSSSTINMARFVFTEFQRASGPGGQGIVSNFGGQVTIGGGSVSSNNAMGDGVASIDIRNTATNITLDSVAIDTDDPGESGGGIYLQNNTGSFTLESASAFAARNTTGIYASNAGTVSIGTVSAVSVTSYGTAALDITNTTVNLTLNNVSAPTSTGRGVRLDGISGTVAVNGTLNLNNSSATGGPALDLANLASGTSVTFSGTSKTITSGANDAIRMNGNDGSSSVSFTNGGLVVSTTTGTGITAAVGGNLSITGPGNTVSSTGGGRGVDLNSTTIGASGITLQSVSTNGADRAISLVNTGTSGTFVITGTGSTDGSGGTLAATTDTAIWLQNVNDVIFANMVVNGSGNHGIRGQSTVDLQLVNIDTQGSFGSSVGQGTVYMYNAGGTLTILGGTYGGASDNTIQIDKTNGGTLTLAISDATIFAGDDLTPGLGNDALQISVSGGAINGTITNNTFAGALANHIQIIASQSANLDLDIGGTGVGNTFQRHGSNPTSGGGGVNAAFTGSGTVALDILDNDMSAIYSAGSGVSPIEIQTGSLFSGTLTSQVRNNTIGTSGVTGSGAGGSSGFGGFAMQFGADGGGTASYVVSNNIIHDYNDSGIKFFQPGGATQDVTAVITGNQVNHTSGAGFPVAGIEIDAGSGNTGSMCADITGNTVTNSSGFLVGGIYVTSDSGHTFNLVGTPVGSSTGPAIASVLNGTNTLSPPAVGGNNGTYNIVAACP